jgi:hypothetical protein
MVDSVLGRMRVDGRDVDRLVSRSASMGSSAKFRNLLCSSVFRTQRKVVVELSTVEERSSLSALSRSPPGCNGVGHY